MSKMKKAMASAAAVTLSAAMAVSSVSGCTLLYVGANRTTTGQTFLARSEDYSNSYNKIAYVSKAGLHQTGDTYDGCDGFQWTYTHPSYSYTAVRDDNAGGVCPDCGKEHDHTPMEEAGTNEKGVTVSAMVTLSVLGGKSGTLMEQDPMKKAGICESDMATILLGEAGSAREGVKLLEQIYNTVGAGERSGVLISDENETWYVENYTGSQYIGVKLSDDMIFTSPNMGAIGLVDLDDTENVICSDKVIAVAEAAGTYVGDKEQNTIDFRASYSATNINTRMTNGLNYLNSHYGFEDDSDYGSEQFTISNVDETGEIVSLYTDIDADRSISIEDMMNFYKVADIGNNRNLEYHVFAITPAGTDGTVTEATDTVEWLALNCGLYNVMVPYYPMLTTDLLDAYEVGGMTRGTTNSEKPEGVVSYPTKDRSGNTVYVTPPEGWETSYYWTMDALSNYALSEECSEEMRELILNNLSDLQAELVEELNTASGELKKLSGEDFAAAQEASTEMSCGMAQRVLNMAQGLFFYANAGGAVKFETTYGTSAADLGLPEGFTLVADTVNTTGETELKIAYNGEPSFSVPAVVTGIQDVFADVANDSWYAGAVAFVKENGLMAGVADKTFAPEATLTRAMMVQVLYNMEQCPEVSGNGGYFDVADGAWYAKAVAWAKESGVAVGVGNGSFAPDNALTREQMVVMLRNYENVKGGETHAEGDLSAYTDASGISAWAADAFKWAVANKVVNGVSATELAPQKTANRAQCAAVLMNYRTFL